MTVRLFTKICYLSRITHAMIGLQNENEEKSDQASQKRDAGSNGAPIMAHQSMASGPGWSLPLAAAFWYSRPKSIPYNGDASAHNHSPTTTPRNIR